MSIKVESTGIPPEATSVATLAETVETKSAPETKESESKDTEDKGETLEASDTSETGSEDTAKDDDSDESESKDGDQPKTGKKNGFKKRIDKLNKRVADKDREVEYWREQAMKGQATRQETKPTETKVEASGKPRAEDFERHEEFVEALSDWKVDQKLKDRDVKARQDSAKAEQSKLERSFQEGCKKIRDTQDDYDEVIEDAQSVSVSPAVEALLLESENGPEIYYELAKDRKEFERICRLSPLAAAREIGKFETRFTKATESETKTEKKTTKAPAPVTPIGAKSGSVKKSIHDPDISQAEYEKLRRAQQAQRA